MKQFILVLSALCCMCPYILADRITIHNKTPYDIFLAIYYLKNDNAERVTAITLLESDSSTSMERPARKFNVDRELVFSVDEQKLAPELTQADLEQLRAKNIGSFKGDVFYIGRY